VLGILIDRTEAGLKPTLCYPTQQARGRRETTEKVGVLGEKNSK
jgi:hypothetical protein